MRRASAFAATLVLALQPACGGDDDESEPRRAEKSPAEKGPAPSSEGRIAGTGYDLALPRGFEDGGRGEGAIDLLLLAKARSGFPVNISVARTPAPPGAAAADTRQAVRRQSEAQGGRSIRSLPDRDVDGKPAIGYTFLRAGPSSPLRQRVYSVVHERGFYAVAITAPASAAQRAERTLDGVLDSWRWR